MGDLGDRAGEQDDCAQERRILSEARADFADRATNELGRRQSLPAFLSLQFRLAGAHTTEAVLVDRQEEVVFAVDTVVDESRCDTCCSHIALIVNPS